MENFGHGSDNPLVPRHPAALKDYEILWKKNSILPLHDLRLVIGEIYQEKYALDFFHDNTGR